MIIKIFSFFKRTKTKRLKHGSHLEQDADTGQFWFKSASEAEIAMALQLGISDMTLKAQKKDEKDLDSKIIIYSLIHDELKF